MKGRIFPKIYQVVKKIPKGRVSTYKLIGEKAGGVNPRIVGFALHQNPDSKRVPCHRVVSKNGELAKNYRFRGLKEQKRKLLKEGVKFKDRNHVFLEKFLWPRP